MILFYALPVFETTLLVLSGLTIMANSFYLKE